MKHDTIAGENIQKLARKCWRVLIDVIGRDREREMPRIVVRRRAHHRSTGTAYHDHIAMTFGANADAAKVRELLLHELAHSAHYISGRAGLPHGKEYNRILVDAAAKLWGVHVGYGTGYGPSRTLERMLREQLAAKEVA